MRPCRLKTDCIAQLNTTGTFDTMEDASDDEDDYQICEEPANERRLSSLSVAQIKALTGYTLSVLSCAAMEWGVTFDSMIIATLFLHMNMTFEQLSILLAGYGVKKSESSLRRLFHKVVAAAPAEGYYKPELRKRYSIPEFPQMTAIVDGVPLRCRADAEHYNDKNKAKTVVFQVITDLVGRPIAWNRGETGNRTDAYSADGWVPFPYRPDEFFFGDVMYSSSAHCVTHWKIGAKTQYTKVQRSNFELVHRKVRARVEHYFARLNRHQIMTRCRFPPTVIPSIFNMIMHLDSRQLMTVPLALMYDAERGMDWKLQGGDPTLGECNCGMISLRSIPGKERNTSIHRHRLMKTTKADSLHPLIIVNKGSKNCKKGSQNCKKGSRFYFAATKKQISKKFKERKELRSLKVLQDMAFKVKRSKERKAALSRARKEEKAKQIKTGQKGRACK